MMNIMMSVTMGSTAVILFFVLYFVALKTERTLFGVIATKELRDSDAGKKAVKDFKKESWIIFVVSLVLLVPVYFIKGDAIPFTYWMVWFMGIVVAYNVPFAVQNSRLKAYKNENKKEEEENTTSYCELKTVRKTKFIHFIPQIVVTILLGLPLFIERLWRIEDTYIELYLINYVSMAFTLALLVFFAILMDKAKVVVISTDSTLNQNYARAKKNVWKGIWMVLSWQAVASILVLGILMCVPHGYELFIGFVLLLSFVMIGTALIGYLKINKIEKSYMNSIDMKLNRDDDKYWIFGMFYFNPKDQSVMIEKRYGVGTTINMASKGGIASMIVTLLCLLLIPIFCGYLILVEKTPMHMTAEEGKVIVYQLKEEYAVDIDTMTEVTLLYECPEASKISGTGMENLQSGTWKTKEYGKVKMYLNPQNEKFIMFNVGDDTYIFGGYDDEETMRVYNEIMASL